jgi:predicted transcriptional regulator
MGRHRENIEIVADILRVAIEGNGKTKIMYNANLSYTLLCKYLKLICSCGLLDNSSKKYELTIKGREFLNRYDSYNEKRKYIAESILVLNSQRETIERILEAPKLR